MQMLKTEVAGGRAASRLGTVLLAVLIVSLLGAASSAQTMPAWSCASPNCRRKSTSR